MAEREISYCFTLAQKRREVITLRLNEQTLERIDQPPGPLPDWTRIDFHQCPHCPLEPDSHPHCPVAVSLVGVTSRFEDIISYDEVELTVVTRERTVSRQTTAQRAISSLLGLLFATSGCPHTRFFKPMARFHLPLATEEDTIFRAAGMYLLGQYFRRKEGQSVDLDLAGLTTLYQNLHLLNVAIASRLRTALTSDSSVNAVILLDMFTNALPFVIKDKLQDIRNLFTPYIDGHDQQPA